MSPRTKRLILIIVFAQLLLIVGLLALPAAVTAIPGRYRVALSERAPVLGELYENVLAQVAPEKTTLPAPERVAQLPAVTIPALAQEPESAPEPTTQPTPEVAINGTDETTEEGVVASPTPTVSPTSTKVPTPTPSPTPLPRSVLLEGIERVQQGFNNCGPANLTQVLNWYGDPTTQTEAASYLKPNPEDRNVSPWQLSDYVNEFTALRSTVHSGGDIDLLKRLIAAGYPVVIEKGYEPQTAGAQGWFGHYLTVFAYDEDTRELTSMDSYLKVGPEGRSDPYDFIEQYWQHFNYTFYVVYEPEDEAEVYEIIGPELLDPLTMWEHAAERAQADIDADPNNAFAWFNLGTSLTRLGELTGGREFYESGASAFDQARTIGLPPRMLWYEFRPYLAYMKVGRYDDMITLADTILETQGGRNVEETYLYRGHALLFTGQVNEAVSDYQRALQLNENFYPAQIALESVGG
ncbi:MAG: C39 family peptidase [Candidatus Promineifilaceae bacterium]|nr:C39 family peptidase [Candidatus Promineifilaceae bacterium]